MTTKERAVRIISRLPDDATVPEIMARLYVQLKVERGIRQLEAGKGLKHSKAKERPPSARKSWGTTG